MKYDIFISYKRKSLPLANNLYYRLTIKGYSTFFDLEEMGRDNFNVQLLEHIENAKDVFVILEEGSLDACKTDDWQKDWFCHEIEYSLKKRKNIIPILIGDFKMPPESFFPDKLKELSLKNAPEFNITYFDEYLERLIKKEYLLSKPTIDVKATSVFKFYSDENCQVFKEGKIVCKLEGLSETPYYLPVQRKGDYRFRIVNSTTSETKHIIEHIDFNEEKDIEIKWNDHISSSLDPTRKDKPVINGEKYIVKFGDIEFSMIRVKGGNTVIGASPEQSEAEDNERPAHEVTISTFYIGQYPVTQQIWEYIMGYNKSLHKSINDNGKTALTTLKKITGAAIGLPFGALGTTLGALAGASGKLDSWFEKDSRDFNQFPIENISYDEALEFVQRLSKMTDIQFSLPTEEEWEYAARGGSCSLNYKYAGSDTIEEVAWYKDNSKGKTHPVGQKKPNELGLYDMSGNVWEWTTTPAHKYLTEPGTTDNFYIRRGGSWAHEAKDCRITKRGTFNHSKKTGGLGIRLVIRDNISKKR